MRPKKEDLVKRFEEITKQEIKNYNDSLLGIHTALNNLSHSIKSVSDRTAQVNASLHSQLKKLESENVSLKDIVSRLEKKLDDLTRKFQSLESDYDTEKRKEALYGVSLESKIDANKADQERTAKELKAHVSKFEESIKNVQMGISRYYDKSIRDNEVLKKEILDLPSEAKEMKKDLLSKIDSYRIDNEGILKELKIVKKKVFVHDKMNEYFTTQLDRVKSSIKST